MFRHPFEVIHQQLGIFENIGIDPLKDVSFFTPFGTGEHPNGIVDVSAAVIA
jgi:hypothetical protein